MLEVFNFSRFWVHINNKFFLSEWLKWKAIWNKYSLYVTMKYGCVNAAWKAKKHMFNIIKRAIQRYQAWNPFAGDDGHLQNFKRKPLIDIGLKNTYLIFLKKLSNHTRLYLRTHTPPAASTHYLVWFKSIKEAFFCFSIQCCFSWIFIINHSYSHFLLH